ncbi:MAG: hypothetical protein KAS93_01900 [Gammaproteobacteria bacterium]|nr:hypothetical protein [Gammaproteobacteria bacterium]
MKKTHNKLTLILISLIFALLITQTSCSKVTTKKQTIDKSKLLSHVTLTVPETKTTISFNAMHSKPVDYTSDKGQFAEHGILSLRTRHIQPLGNQGFVTILAVSRGGSGTFIYVARFDQGKLGYKMTDSFLLGDRVQVTALAIDHKNKIIISYKKHGENQGMYEAPNVPVQKKISLPHPNKK